MAKTKDEILIEALTLSPEDRELLAEDLWQSVVPEELSNDQLAEIQRRINAIDSGQEVTIPGEQVMAELFRKLAIAKAS